MAYDAAPDAPVYMTHAGMMDRVRYLEQWSIQHKNLCDDRHKWTVDRVKWMVDRVNYNGALRRMAQEEFSVISYMQLLLAAYTLVRTKSTYLLFKQK